MPRSHPRMGDPGRRSARPAARWAQISTARPRRRPIAIPCNRCRRPSPPPTPLRRASCGTRTRPRIGGRALAQAKSMHWWLRPCTPIPRCKSPKPRCASRSRTSPRSEAPTFRPCRPPSAPARIAMPCRCSSPTLTSGVATFALYTPQLTVSYVPDLFGGNRRQVESLQALADANRYEYDAAYLTLTANVVSAAIQEARPARADRSDAAGDRPGARIA